MATNGVVFEIIKHIGTIRKHENGWAKELNIVAWNGGEPKYDIRDWDAKHEYMTRGITLTRTDMASLISIIDDARNKEEI